MEKLRERIKDLNLAYLETIKEIGTDQEHRSYAQTALGLDNNTLILLQGLDLPETEQMAAVGTPLFRLKYNHLKQAKSLCKKGNLVRAFSLVSASLLTNGNADGNGREEKDDDQ